MLCELATLSCPLLAVEKAAEAAAAWVHDSQAKGRLLGCWRTEIGTLGRLLVLRGFEAPEDMTAERRRALLSDNPFNAGSVVTALEMDSYAPFPFLPPIRTGDRGGVYEFRTYRLKPGGLSPTLAGWEAGIAPAREYTAHLVVNMYALDGAPELLTSGASAAWRSEPHLEPRLTEPAFGLPRAAPSRSSKRRRRSLCRWAGGPP
jgi:hypothetical protein